MWKSSDYTNPARLDKICWGYALTVEDVSIAGFLAPLRKRRCKTLIKHFMGSLRWLLLLSHVVKVTMSTFICIIVLVPMSM